MLTIKFAASFRRDYKRIQKRGYDLSKLDPVLEMLANEQELPEKYRVHTLIGEYKGCQECHITPDWLLVYRILDQDLILYMMRTGTHSDILHH